MDDAPVHHYYILATGTILLPHANGFPWPYAIALCFDAVDYPVELSEGVGHGSAGGTFSVAEALEPEWRAHFSKAGGQWLIPYLERLRNGEALDQDELLAMAGTRLGRDPERHDVPSAAAHRR